MDTSGQTVPVVHQHISRRVVRPPATNTATGRLQIKTIAGDFLQAWKQLPHSLISNEFKED